ncbi:MAG TPA: glycosyltransferase family 4 protein [Anaerolineales bacterium]|nr:glycosyltransferase family 4 protein [Anaerolineales bacterium]
MRVLLLYEYPPPPAGLATQGHLLFQGLQEIGVESHAVNLNSPEEKAWYYSWFHPDVVVGVGYWGHTPDIILHPLRHSVQPVPWLVADGYVANYHDVLNGLPLILVTSNWVKQVYVRDGIRGDNIEVLPVGCNTNLFRPRARLHPQLLAVREALGVSPEELMILTVGGDAASKGAREVMQALALIADQVPAWKYVCKVWPQQRTQVQNAADLQLAADLGIAKHVIYVTSTTSRNFIPYLMSACDIYAAPARLEGFGMPQVEAGASGKPVVGLRAMGMLDTLVHERTALLANVAEEIVVTEQIRGRESGFEEGHKIIFDSPRTVDYRASVPDIARFLQALMIDPELRERLGSAGREHVVRYFDYRVVARQFVDIIRGRLGIE